MDLFNLVIGMNGGHTIAGYMPTGCNVEVGDYVTAGGIDKEWRVVYSENYTALNSSTWRIATAATQSVPQKITKVIKHERVRWEGDDDE